MADKMNALFDIIPQFLGSWSNLFTTSGFMILTVAVICAICTFLDALNVHFMGAFTVKQRLRQYGKWAVVTGCTRGMGKEFTLLLAKCGLDLVLVARDQVKMREIADHCEKEYGIRTECVCVDFFQGPLIYDKIRAAIADKEVGILINNVGVMYDHPDYFVDISEKRLWELINVNMGSCQAMAHLVLNSCMMKRRRGLIVFMGSLSCYHPMPLYAAYAATKSFENYLGKCLYYECRPQNIHVQTLTASWVATDMAAYNTMVGDPNILSPSAKTFVKHASWTLGRTGMTTGYFPHTVLRWGAWIMGEYLYVIMITQLMILFRRTGKARLAELQRKNT